MIVFPKGVRFEFVIAGALLVGSCDGPGLSAKQRDEVSEIAVDETHDAVGVKVEALESRVTDIEQKLNM